MNDSTNASELSFPSRPRLRIAVVGLRGLPSNYSGIERVGEELYSALARRGHEVTVYGRPSHMTERVTEFRGTRVIRTSTIAWPPLETLSQALSSFPYAARRGQFDVVHLHALAPALVLMGYWLKRVPTVLTVHGLDWQRAKWTGLGAFVLKQAERCGVRFANEIIVVSNSLKEYFAEQYKRRTTLIYNAVNSPVATLPWNGYALAKYKLRPRNYVIFVGRLVPEKRVDDLIMAFGQLRADFKLVIVGDGPTSYVSYLKSLIGSDARIIFTGLQEQSTLHQLLRSAAAYVLPSELEGFPMSLMECIEHGVPAIVSDIPPHRELLGAVGGYDLFFGVRNRLELAERLSCVLQHSERYQELAERAREHVRKTFSAKLMIDRTEEVLFRAVQSVSA